LWAEYTDFKSLTGGGLTDGGYYFCYDPDEYFTPIENSIDTDKCMAKWKVTLYERFQQRIVTSWLNDITPENQL